MMNQAEPHPFNVGDRVIGENGHYGVIREIETDEINKPHHRVAVRWDRGSKSYREAEGLTKVQE